MRQLNARIHPQKSGLSRLFLEIVLLSALILTACSKQDAPARAIEAYIQALVSKDANALSNVSCKSWEDQARIELDGFTAISIKTDSLQCQSGEKDGSNQLVTCKGKIIANYNGENQEFPLDRRTYLAVQEDGEWRMCGYK